MTAAALVAAAIFAWFIQRGFSEHEHSFSPQFADIHNTTGTLLFQQNRPEEAIPQFQRALELEPGHAEAANNLGNVLLQQGRWDEAMDSYRKALTLRPRYSDALNNIGLALLQKARLDEAIGHFLAALDYRPDYADAHNNLGSALMRKNRFVEAIPHFEAALALNSSIGQAQHNLALSHFSLGHVQEALTHYEAAIKLNPGQVGSINNLAWLLATTEDAQLRNGARALELARQADSLTSGQDATILHTLAAALAENGQFAEAATLAERARRIAVTAANETLATVIGEQIQVYQAGRPWREKAPERQAP
jgi:tetratricopeptide (TPR) repeat protein